MNDLINKIIRNIQIREIFEYVINNLYRNGPVNGTDMEILSYLALYHSELFVNYEARILNYMGVFYKDVGRSTLREVVFSQYRKYIQNLYKEYYTPVQADILKHVNRENYFSFSAPTSTGKSYVFINLIEKGIKDTVVVVPSRALINEYYLKLCESIRDKTINILTFIDKINTATAKRNIFVVTPERCRELFKQKGDFDVDLFLFDEAQLSDEASTRGLFYDSIVRRCNKAYPEAKLVFAHPFIQNPKAQLLKNHLLGGDGILYNQKNVGQLYLVIDENQKFYHFGIDKNVMGRKRVRCDFDPIERSLRNGGSILFYVSKAMIYDNVFLSKYRRYIDLCPSIDEGEVEHYINELKSYTGGDTVASREHFSSMISLLKKGIVTHHGSLPLRARSVIEQYTRRGCCKLCFATSTLEQGINMPFDVVVIDRFEASRPLEMKNLIGRAGRSSKSPKFDYGYVVISSNNISKFRDIMATPNELDPVSALDKDDDDESSDYLEFKEAIRSGRFSDQFNLTNKDLEKLSNEDSHEHVRMILDIFYNEGELISLAQINNDRNDLYRFFELLYRLYLGRDLSEGERGVLYTAVKIMLWRIHGRTFKKICWYRYSYVSRSAERRRVGSGSENLDAAFVTGYNDIPNKNLKLYSLFKRGTKARDVDYDRIVYDTYDYIDKLIGFKLSDIFYAAFYLYYEKTQDERSMSLANFVKYGTDNERHIWMIRYGLSFEDIEVLDAHIESIGEKGIVFKDSINAVPEEKKQSVIRYL